MAFNRIATFATPRNMAAGEDTSRASSAEIITATEDGMTLLYTDSPLGVVGAVDITDPQAPRPLGNIAMGGEPTTAVVIGARAFAAVNTSASYAEPSGKLVTIDIAAQTVLSECDLGGQPDSVARAKDGSFLAIAIENERDEDLNDGQIPQMPAGFVVKLPVKDGMADCAAMQRIEMTGLAAIAPEDPEPEFVDINDAGEIVVTLQENNHIVIIGADGTVTGHFSAGAVTLEGIDLTDERGAIRFSETQADRKREPDGIKWLGTDRLVTANEGDYEGGSRGWTIFKRDGSVVYESGADFEHAVAQIGHYPDRRSDAKGIEPESIEVATFGDRPMVFVAAERASVVGVYDVTDPSAPVLTQILPSGVSPEGMVAIPARNLLASANEVDLVEDGGVRAHVMVYELQDAPAAYPMITSQGADELIGWGALSGLVADADRPGLLYAVNDSFFGYQPTIFTIDATQKPARIVAALPVTRGGMPAQKLDMEGITLDGKGGFWVASEGRSDQLVPHALYSVNARGEVRKEIALPAALAASEIRFGFEGITRVGDMLWMAVQREWKDDVAGEVKLIAYNTAEDAWTAVRYPLDAKGEGWIGLSEITAHGDWFYIVERDNQIGGTAKVKRLYRVPAAQMIGAPVGGDLPLVQKELVRDLLPDLAALNGYAAEKIEGLAIDAAGEGWVVTDNDGVDDSSGETLFWSIGKLAE
ncbi:esterase-like activity of phytase family protein [Acidimangrovimonas sediminis]|uniref:Esterase-like activity of phytase family protein n=1 Tax=Albidovulum sediminis TaxID=3066345 RepID=A0ABT2NMW5_9RHOB|nr:esterase-like activity of phytase family protein [Defluviimonas sediminis]MCT8330273.1 esterase-like activity of phytase family protein [Defluviimonas sediminis]